MRKLDIVKIITNAFADTPMPAEEKIMRWGSGSNEGQANGWRAPRELWDAVVRAQSVVGKKSAKELAALRRWVEYVEQTKPGDDFAWVWKGLAGKRWQDLKPKDIRSGHAALSMMTPEGAQYFLPAYLILIITKPDRADWEIDKTIHFLSPPPFGFETKEQFEANIGLLSELQRVAISHFFEYVRSSPVLFGEGDSPHDRLTTYWLKYST
jgi:hypothetical protein